MARPPWSTRFFHGSIGVSASPTLLYTVPADRVAVIRKVLGYNVNSAAGALTFGKGDPNVAANRILSEAVPALGVIDRDWWQVFNAGETVQAYRTAGIGIQLSISGYLLDVTP